MNPLKSFGWILLYLLKSRPSFKDGPYIYLFSRLILQTWGQQCTVRKRHNVSTGVHHVHLTTSPPSCLKMSKHQTRYLPVLPGISPAASCHDFAWRPIIFNQTGPWRGISRCRTPKKKLCRLEKISWDQLTAGKLKACRSWWWFNSGYFPPGGFIRKYSVTVNNKCNNLTDPQEHLLKYPPPPPPLWHLRQTTPLSPW